MDERLTYLVLELGWALPPILLQWIAGWQLLQRQKRAWLLGILIPTAYLALADSTALGIVWAISPQKSLGIFLGNVPIEEVVFFFLTNTLIVQSVLIVRCAGELVELWQSRLRAIPLPSFIQERGKG
jgi:lycopene cyclase domain-containing protein